MREIWQIFIDMVKPESISRFGRSDRAGITIQTCQLSDKHVHHVVEDTDYLVEHAVELATGR